MNTTHVLAAGVYTNKEYNLTQLQQLPLQLDQQGNLRVTMSNSEPTVSSFVQITDGTNTQPTLDVPARAGYVELTDGTNTVSVNSASALKVYQSPTTQPMTPLAIEADAGRLFIVNNNVTLIHKNTVYVLMLIRNPLGSGKKCFVHSITMNNLTSANMLTVTVSAMPTVTTVGENVPIITSNIGSGNVAVANCHNNGTIVSSLGSTIAILSCSGEEKTLSFDFGLILQANASLLVSGQAYDNSQIVSTRVVYSEV